jgi:hypothetical protein
MRLIVLICCGAALLSAGGSLLLTGRYETALIAAVAMLVCAQVVALLASGKPREVEDARLANLSEGIKRNARSIEQLSTRTRDHAQALAEMKQALDQARAQTAIAAPQPRPLAAAPQLSSVAAGPALPSNQPAATGHRHRAAAATASHSSGARCPPVRGPYSLLQGQPAAACCRSRRQTSADCKRRYQHQ